MSPLYTPKDDGFSCENKELLGCSGCIFSRSCAQFDGARGNMDGAVHTRGDYDVTVYDKASGRRLWTKRVDTEKKRRGC
jgi:hypothetical protein